MLWHVRVPQHLMSNCQEAAAFVPGWVNLLDMRFPCPHCVLIKNPFLLIRMKVGKRLRRLRKQKKLALKTHKLFLIKSPHTFLKSPSIFCQKNLLNSSHSPNLKASTALSIRGSEI